MDKKKKEKVDTDDWNPLRSVAIASGAGMTILVSIGVGVWMGLKVDEYLGTYPWGLIVLSILGAASGLWSVIKQILGKK